MLLLIFWLFLRKYKVLRISLKKINEEKKFFLYQIYWILNNLFILNYEKSPYNLLNIELKNPMKKVSIILNNSFIFNYEKNPNNLVNLYTL